MLGDSYSDAARELADALKHYSDELANLPEPIQHIVQNAANAVDKARELIDWSQNHTHINTYIRTGADKLDKETLAKFGGYHRAERQGT